MGITWRRAPISGLRRRLRFLRRRIHVKNPNAGRAALMQLYACQTVQHALHGWGTVLSYTATHAKIRTRAGELEVDRAEIVVPQIAKAAPKAPRTIPQLDTCSSWGALAADIARGPYRLEVQTKHDLLDELQ